MMVFLDFALLLALISSAVAFRSSSSIRDNFARMKPKSIIQSRTCLKSKLNYKSLFSRDSLIREEDYLDISAFNSTNDMKLFPTAIVDPMWDDTVVNQVSSNFSTVENQFFDSYDKPIHSNFKAFFSRMIQVNMADITNPSFTYDPIFALGLCTKFYSVMQEFSAVNETDVLFDLMMQSLSLDAYQIRSDARKVLYSIKDIKRKNFSILRTKSTYMAGIFRKLREMNTSFMVTESWGIGLCRIMELMRISVSQSNLERWATSLKFENPMRVLSFWKSFCKLNKEYSIRKKFFYFKHLRIKSFSSRHNTYRGELLKRLNRDLANVEIKKVPPSGEWDAGKNIDFKTWKEDVLKQVRKIQEGHEKTQSLLDIAANEK